MSGAYIEVVVCTGRYDPPKIVRVPMAETLARELTTGWEMSNEPFSLLLESFGQADKTESFVKMRKRAVDFRGGVADECMKMIRRALMDAFAADDTQNGYKRDQL